MFVFFGGGRSIPAFFCITSYWSAFLCLNVWPIFMLWLEKYFNSTVHIAYLPAGIQCGFACKAVWTNSSNNWFLSSTFIRMFGAKIQKDIQFSLKAEPHISVGLWLGINRIKIITRAIKIPHKRLARYNKFYFICPKFVNIHKNTWKQLVLAMSVNVQTYLECMVIK